MRSELSTYVLGLGGNIHPRRETLNRARILIAREIGRILRASSLYESQAWGFTTEIPFVNQHIVVESLFPPRRVLEAALQIEAQLGRKRPNPGMGYASRPIDIDILLWGAATVQEPGLIIPHPLIARRRFVLDPLLELEPNGLHPTLRTSWRELLAQCEDQLWVRRIDGGTSAPVGGKTRMGASSKPLGEIRDPDS